MYIPKRKREIVAERANCKCEYCLIREAYSFYKFQVEHIISLKHGGSSNLYNLAYACPTCNRLKGSDLGSILLPDEKLIRFFNPRKDDWLDHFEVSSTGMIYAKTQQAEVTIKIFQFNHPDTIIERRLLVDIGLYP